MSSHRSLARGGAAFLAYASLLTFVACTSPTVDGTWSLDKEHLRASIPESSWSSWESRYWDIVLKDGTFEMRAYTGSRPESASGTYRQRGDRLVLLDAGRSRALEFVHDGDYLWVANLNFPVPVRLSRN